MGKLTHLDDKGQARMVDVSAKDVTMRLATARGRISMTAETLAMITEGRAKKGDVLAAARIAGIMAGKMAHELIPLCHQLLIPGVSGDLALATTAISIEVEATGNDQCTTGYEMEPPT